MIRNKVLTFSNTIVLIMLVYFYSKHLMFIQQPFSISASKMHDDLKQEIIEKAKQYEEAPENAYIDEVWKKTPGRNGKMVNIEKSYKNMKKEGKFKEEKLIFDEIPPEISLADLPPSPIYRGHPEKEMVALLINVSWGTEYIPEILQTLNKHQVKATFFIEGKWANENKTVVEMIHEQNHLIGNHAYNHPDMARISREEIKEQIEKTNSIIEAIIDERPKWFAPPSGSYNDDVVNIAHNLGMETVLWTVDTIDWKNPSVSVMINRVMNKIHPGATILMHPTEPVSQGLDELIEEIKHENYKLGTIENLLSEKR